jgi:hypothetical protein
MRMHATEADMRVSLRILGWEIVALELGTPAAEVDYDEPGDATSTYAGFVATHDIPDEAQLPDRYPWDD